MSGSLGAQLAEQLSRALSAAGIAPLRAVEAGERPSPLWARLAELDLSMALVPEGLGGAGLGFGDVVAALIALGRAGAPAPLAESMGAAALLGAGGYPPPQGLLSFAAVGQPVPWGRFVPHVVLVEEQRVHLYPAARVEWRWGQNLAAEPRDSAEPHGQAVVTLSLPPAFGTEAAFLLTAWLRAALIAGALETALAVVVEHARTRRQFGRPIGSFQAVQQQLAVMAGETAAAVMAVAAAARAIDRGGLPKLPGRLAAPKSPRAKLQGGGRRSPIRWSQLWGSPLTIRCTSVPAASGHGARKVAASAFGPRGLGLWRNGIPGRCGS